MKKLTILVDMDDVLCDLCGSWVAWLNKKYGTNVKTSEIRSWDIASVFPTLTKTEVFSPLFTPVFWDSVNPVDESQKYLKHIIDDGHKVVIVTASHPDTISHKLNRCLFKYFPFLTYKDVITTGQKGLIKGDILIDDAPHNFDGFDGVGILMSANHNARFDVKGRKMLRCNSWKEVYDAICLFDGR